MPPPSSPAYPHSRSSPAGPVRRSVSPIIDPEISNETTIARPTTNSTSLDPARVTSVPPPPVSEDPTLPPINSLRNSIVNNQPSEPTNSNTIRGIGSRLNSLNIISDYYFRNNPSEHPGYRSAFFPRPPIYSAPGESNLPVNILPSPLRNIETARVPGIGRYRISRRTEEDVAEEDPRFSRSTPNGEELDEEEEEDDDDDDDDDDEEAYDDNSMVEGDEDNNISYTESEASRASQFIDSIDVAGDSSESESGDGSREARLTLDSNERLLLSSARQNTTGANRIITRPIPINDTLHLGGTNSFGVPLQRQNAIRNRRMHHKRAFYKQGSGVEYEDSKQYLKSSIERMTSDSRVLSSDISSVISWLKRGLMNQSLFSSFSQKISLNYCLGGGIEYEDSLESIMDNYLKLRKNKDVWIRSAQFSQHQLDLRTKSLNSNNTQKRKATHLTLPFLKNKKRRTTQIPEDDPPYSHQEIDTPESLNVLHDLSAEEKYNVISVQYSSYFKTGSAFEVFSPWSEVSTSDLVFTNVNYDSKTLDGYFNLTGMSDWVSFWNNLFKHVEYFCGAEWFSQAKLLGNSSLARRLFLLKRVKVHLEDEPLNRTIKAQSLSIPIHGKIVDFKKHDLRFLTASNSITKTGKVNYNNENYAFTKYSSPTFKFNLPNLQLSEWMRVRPFQQFKDEYLHAYAQEMSSQLMEVSLGGAKPQSQDLLDLASKFRRNIGLLTKTFGGTDEPSALSTPLIPDRLYPQDWEKRLSRELLKKITNSDNEDLLNIQLNYTLFTVKVDLVKFLDSILDVILQNFEYESQTLQAECKEIRYLMELTKLFDNESSEKEDLSAILLGSLNRKSGSLELHNTLPNIIYKNQTTRRVNGVSDSGLNSGIPMSSTRSTNFSNSHTDVLSASSALFDSYGSWNRWFQDDRLQDRSFRMSSTSQCRSPYETGEGQYNMTGVSKQNGSSSQSEFAVGGGNPSFDIT